MHCANCRLSLKALKKMQQNKEPFYTVARHKRLLIADVNENTEKIRMQRSTGKITWSLDYHRLKEVHDLIHEGRLMVNPKAIAKAVPTWGTYIMALLKHLGNHRGRCCARCVARIKVFDSM